MSNTKIDEANSKAGQQKSASGIDAKNRMGGKSAPANLGVRASIPTYDRSSVKKVQTGMRGIKKN